MNSSTLKRKFKLTALQITAMFILPLFVFALVVKVKERKENESSIDKVVSTQNSYNQYFIIHTVSHDSKNVKNSDSVK